MKRLQSFLFLIIAAVLALAGCAGVPTQTSPGEQSAAQSPLSSLANVAAADLDTAAKQADADGDAVGAACWRAMQTWLGNRPAAAHVVGAFSAIQAARSARLRVASGVPTDVHVKCSPVVLDAQGVALRLGLLAAGKGLLP